MSSGEIVNASTSAASTPRDVYARLYDRRSYTGVYKKRFEADCHDLTEKNVHDLSNTMRTNLNYDVDPRTKRAVSPRLNTVGTATSIPEEAPALSPVARPTAGNSDSLQGDPNDPHTLLKAVFHYYCRFGRTGAKGVGEKTMDNSNFSKLCRDCPDLVDSTFTSIDVDLIFVKAKKKGERRINYTRFLDALGMIALQKYGEMPLEASVPKLLEAHIARLSCILEFTDGKTVQAVWQKRAERDESPDPPLPPPPASPSVLSTLFSGPVAAPKNNQEAATLPPPAPMSVPISENAEDTMME